MIGRPETSDSELSRTLSVLREAGGKQTVAAKTLGITDGAMHYRIKQAEKRGIVLGDEVVEDAKMLAKIDPVERHGRIHAMQTVARDVPGAGVRRYLFTCAQNDTKLHEAFWQNLLAFAADLNAEIHVSRFAYVKTGLGEGSDKAGWTARNVGEKGKRDRTWDSALGPYLSDGRMKVAPGLIWCGEMNIIPTAQKPLSGLDSYTGQASGIFPHVKLAMDSIASPAGEPAKFNYTTGAVTQRNYIQRKAGLMAEFHHCYGALLVEVDAVGDWFARQINANSEGEFYDLDLYVSAGVVTRGHRVEAITWGDIHDAERVAWVDELAFGFGGMLDSLGPRYQFLHDVLHFRGRSHHEIKNPHVMFARHVQGQTDVAAEVAATCRFLDRARRPWCETVVVDSNHHHHLARWLREQDGREDVLNVRFWLAMNLRIYGILARGDKPIYLAEAVREVAGDAAIKDRFLAPDESMVLCPDAGGGIEAGMHGAHGPNGARGSALNLSKLGRKANIGHAHSARIVDGVYQGGTHGELNPDWVSGPGSWSHSEIVTYANGKRCIVTMRNGKWRA
jgi:hypothetical protein